MVAARLDLTTKLGKTPVKWQWSRLHQFTLRHSVLGADSMPAPVQAIFNRGPWQMPGGSAIVNANGWNASQGLRRRLGSADADGCQPRRSGLVALGEPDRELRTPFDAHYVDQTDAWVNNQTYPWPFSEKAVRDGGADELILSPRLVRQLTWASQSWRSRRQG